MFYPNVWKWWLNAVVTTSRRTSLAITFRDSRRSDSFPVAGWWRRAICIYNKISTPRSLLSDIDSLLFLCVQYFHSVFMIYAFRIIYIFQWLPGGTPPDIKQPFFISLIQCHFFFFRRLFASLLGLQISPNDIAEVHGLLHRTTDDAAVADYNYTPSGTTIYLHHHSIRHGLN